MATPVRVATLEPDLDALLATERRLEQAIADARAAAVAAVATAERGIAADDAAALAEDEAACASAIADLDAAA